MNTITILFAIWILWQMLSSLPFSALIKIIITVLAVIAAVYVAFLEAV